MFTFSQFSKYEMLGGHSGKLTYISNRNVKMRCYQTLFSINCWLANWGEKVIGEIQFNPQLL